MDELKKLRTEKGLSQTELAKKVGVSLAAYRLWETGGGKPSSDNLQKLKNVLGIK